MSYFTSLNVEYTSLMCGEAINLAHMLNSFPKKFIKKTHELWTYISLSYMHI